MKKSKYWYVKTRGSYLPSSTMGWISYIPFVAYLLSSVYFSDRLNKHASIWVVIFYALLPDFIAAAALMTILAKKKSRKGSR
jgi:hypothetical protein